jgi:uncharacterized protein (TIGR00255 family)
VELKTLNNKYMEAYVNLPKVLKRRENDILQTLKQSFSRGKLELSIDIYDWVNTKPVYLNEEVIRKYFAVLKRLHSSLRIDVPLALDTILSLEGVSHRERSQITQKSHDEIDKALAQAIKMARKMRMTEGAAIKKDILASVALISGNAASIKKRARDVSRQKADQLRKRLEQLSGKKIGDDRILGEVAVLADKLDINEELVRLQDHIVKFRAVADECGQIGRNLDFLAQEIFREVNTIGSKSNSSEIAHLVVEMKNHIDKIREHCRNII